MEIKCHYAPVTSLPLFCASRYLQKDKYGHNTYSFYDDIIVCPHCTKRFPINSPGFRCHVDLCLNDEPTEYKFPLPDTRWEFNSHTKILGAHYSIYADFECLCQKMRSVCNICEAKLEMVTNINRVKEIRASCNHPKNIPKCAECFMKVSSLTDKIEARCKLGKHEFFIQDGLEMCSKCREYYSEEVNKVTHTSAHVTSCETCVSRHDYCVHTAASTVTTLVPCIVTMVIIDNCFNKLRNEISIASEQPVKEFFQKLDELYIDLEEEFFERYQNYPQLTEEMMTLDERYQFKEDNEVCYMCSCYTPRGSRTVDHSHITGRHAKRH